MGLNLAKLKSVEDNVEEAPIDDIEGADEVVKAPASAAAEPAKPVNEYAALVDEITPSAPPTIDEKSPAVAAKAQTKAPEGEANKQAIKDPVADGLSSDGITKTPATDPSPKADEDPRRAPVGNNDAIESYADILASMDPEAVQEIEKRAKSMAVEAEARRHGIAPSDARQIANEQGRPQHGPGGGGLLDLAAGLVAAPFVGVALGVSKFRRILNEANATASAPVFTETHLRDRIYELKSEQMKKNAITMMEAGQRLGSSVEAFNEAFNGSDRTNALRKMAKDEGVSVDEFLANVTNGKSKPEHLAAIREVLKDPKVAEAWEKVEPGVAAIKDMQNLVHRDFELLNKNFPERFDAEAEAEALKEAVDATITAVPPPVVEDPESKQKLAERLREMAENLIESIKNLIQRIMSIGQAPK